MTAPTSPLSRVIAVLRAPDAERYRPVVGELVAGGIHDIELTLTTPGTLDVVGRLRAEVGDAARIGVGTVTDDALARDALGAGAQFLVTPGVVPNAAELARARGVPIMMGALTPTEVLAAMDAGADLVKIFPAATVGAGYLTQLRGPFPSLRAVPSGGVGPEEARDWLAAGAAAVSIGGPLLGDALHGGSLPRLADRVRELADALRTDGAC